MAKGKSKNIQWRKIGKQQSKAKSSGAALAQC
jgi:hypothetical protein